MNKKAYIRTVEAVISAILLFLVIFTLTPKQKNEIKIPEGIRLTQDAVFNELQTNDKLRNLVGSVNPQSISDINLKIPTNLGYNFMICDSGGSNCYCNNLNSPNNQPGSCDVSILFVPLSKTVYAKSIFISKGTSGNIFRLYLWQK